MKKKWLDILQLSKVSGYSGVCSFHFRNDIKCKTFDKKVRLLRPALPTENVSFDYLTLKNMFEYYEMFFSLCLQLTEEEASRLVMSHICTSGNYLMCLLYFRYLVLQERQFHIQIKHSLPLLISRNQFVDYV